MPPLSGQSPAISANPFFVNTGDFLRDLAAAAAADRANCGGGLSFPKGLDFLGYHAGHLGLGRCTAGGNSQAAERDDALRFQSQQGRLRGYGEPAVP
jgi:hypothetical protein